MIIVGELPNSRAAQALADYLKSQGVPARIRPAESGNFAIEIRDEADLERAQIEFERFLQSPNDPKYYAASWSDGDAKVRFNYQKGPSFFHQLKQGAGPLTLTILSICVAIYLLAVMGLAEAIYTPLFFFANLQQANFAEFWRWFTPVLLHFSIVHLAFNGLWWWMLGGQVEKNLGLSKLLLILLVAALLPNLLQYFMTGPNFGGLSGVVYALMGYCWIMGRRAPQSGLYLAPAYAGFMLFWLALGFMDVLGIPVANGAHLGGLLVGVGQAFIDSHRLNRGGES
ncbi:rhomboid family intramembrane serine protease GlpG [Paraferrimonas haliotis]|uniref:Rhomboid family intramembrane serine protease GlpG n=1 Tax=Paraferrimonas haliotis TaxID=2013866 RepID=A0AA37TN80_9GAMM|nr:rhomboid family intramembrane serine protease GlpG [Paraferrimonas haliotis]GLS83533.1 rhomboid family intramembrane serine protease GlpG [Paraferrimonas haliotis]